MNYHLNYHLSWLETAIYNFKKDNTEIKSISSNMTIGEFIEKYAKKELEQIIQVK